LTEFLVVDKCGVEGGNQKRLQAHYYYRTFGRRLKELRVSFDRQRKGEEASEACGPAASLLPRKMRLFVVTELKVLFSSQPA